MLITKQSGPELLEDRDHDLDGCKSITKKPLTTKQKNGPIEAPNLEINRIKTESGLYKPYKCTSLDEPDSTIQKIPLSDEQFRRSISEDPNARQEKDRSRYPSTDSVASTSINGSRDRLSNGAAGGTIIPSGSSKFGGSTFSITRHKKVDLPAYDEARSHILSDKKDQAENNEPAKYFEQSGSKFESYDVLEKTAAIALEQVNLSNILEGVLLVNGGPALKISQF